MGELRTEHYKFYGEKSLSAKIKAWQKYGGYVSFSAALRDLVLIGLREMDPLIKDQIKVPPSATSDRRGSHN